MAGTEDDLSIGLFGDPSWLPFEQIHRLLWQRLSGDPHVAAVDLTEVLATLVPSLLRSRRFFTDRELLPLEFWNDHDLEWRDDRLVVVRQPAHVLDRADVIEGFVGYAWLPKLAEVWPTVFASMLAQELSPQAPSPEAPELEQPQPPPGNSKATTWVHYAVKRWPREKDEGSSEYVARLLRHAPRKWSKHTIQNALSEEA